MTAVLADELGPRARRRVLIASIVSGLVLLAVVVGALSRLRDQGQLEADLWEPFTKWPEFRFLLLGLKENVRIALVAMGLSMAIGMVLALGRLAQTAPVRWAFTAWVEFFRGLPVLLLIFFSFLMLPRYGLDWPAFWYVVLGLTLYNSAVLGEIFRAGILSLERGQMEASLAIGLTYWKAMRLVVVPQALRRMIPAIVSQLVTLLKDTSLAFIIAYPELLRHANILGTARKNILQSLFVAALLFLVVNLVLSRIARRLEVRQRRRYSAGAIAVSGVEDLAANAAEAESKV
ncbi:MAG TPA: amino acid ABC transporter permease [Acidimicrobiales bacterium]|jgi:glutamate transport system permease protein|nr:amino acid ABC transporter permease [Acidimicrobiales bacterium]